MRKLTILDTVEDIYRALEGKAYLSALALALTIPDILSKVEYPDEGKVGIRYERWINEFYLTEEEKKARTEKLDKSDELTKVLNKLDGHFYYKLRCAFLHSGNNDVESMEGVDFELSFGCGECTSVFGYPDGPCWKHHVLSVYDFCMKMCAITEHLVEEWKSGAEKLDRLENTGIRLFSHDDMPRRI